MQFSVLEYDRFCNLEWFSPSVNWARLSVAGFVKYAVDAKMLVIAVLVIIFYPDF